MPKTASAIIPIYQGDVATQQLTNLTQPALTVDPVVQQRTAAISERVKTDGDTALNKITAELGDAPVQIMDADDPEVTKARKQVSPKTIEVLERAATRITRFNQAFIDRLSPITVCDDAVDTGVRFQPVNHVACYVPGGRYPLPSTALMTAITAKVAGVPEISLVSPKLTPETLAAGNMAGATRFIQLGGAQAVAAMAYGTQTIPAAAMVVGPGNAYVTEAKRQLQGIIGIDGLAGPSEVVIIADDTANPDWVAADLIAQAEHDPDARAYLLTPSQPLAEATQQALTQQLASGTIEPFIADSLAASGLFVLDTLTTCASIANALAPEHLELLVDNPDELKPHLTDYGALFCGHHTPVPIGDYMAGPNHTLPTARAARFSGGLTPLTFLRPQTWQQVKPNQTTIFENAAHFADIEGLVGHAASARYRLNT